MPFLELFDETLDINSTENYELSVEISSLSVSFCILDSIRNKFIMLRSYQPENGKNYTIEEIGDFTGKDDFLLKDYKKVHIITPAAKFTLVPEPLFDPAKKDEYFRLNHLPEEGVSIINNRITDPDSYLIYGLSDSLYNLIKNTWPGVYPIHNLKPLFEHLRLKGRLAENNYIHAHIEYDFFTCIFFINNTLKFCNSFNYRTDSDILYYLLNVFRSLDLKQEETIHISGQTDRFLDLVPSLNTYIRTVKVELPSGDFNFSYVLNDVGLNRFINLFNVFKCV
jgi:hypothetical protein